MHAKGIKSTRYQDDNKLWVPIHYLDCDHRQVEAKLTSSKKMIHFPAFGKEHSKFEMIDNSMSGKVFYLVAGHGGPDPGAMCEKGANTLCEDEYAYDVILRLAKNLISRGAEVEVIIQDPDDGIRSEAYLECDNDEVCLGGAKLPLNQLRRLQQRADVINQHYIKNRRNGLKEQYAIMIHVDSRSVNKNQDVYFYHLDNSKNGKKIAKNLYRIFKSKYAIHRASGQYHGSVSSRNLYMLRSTYPPAVFIELGNLRNPHDQQRIILEDNRQALADWIYEGLNDL
jgi:N-acetylmuramoyl-L-alanine amidase